MYSLWLLVRRLAGAVFHGPTRDEMQLQGQTRPSRKYGLANIGKTLNKVKQPMLAQASQ